ncbi:MAG: hypothetical protein ACKN9T_16350, partial [Candidatus Methylumidiphilus sp.]
MGQNKRKAAAKKADFIIPESHFPEAEFSVVADTGGHPPPNPQAAEEIEAISQEPTALLVANAPHGTDEDSDDAALPVGY